MSCRLLWIGIFVLAAPFWAGCVSNNPNAVGTGAWHTQRIEEIQSAYDAGDLTTEEYLRLKNEADRIRANYRASYPRGSVGVGFGYYSHD